MINRIVVLIFTLVFSIALYAQTETLLVEGVDKTIEIKFLTENKSAADEAIIEFVAKAKAIPSHAAVLSYQVKEHRKIVKNNNKLQLQLSIGNFVFPDEVNYLNFNINKFLHPSLISYTYIWADENDKVLETNSMVNESFKNGSFLLKKNVVNTSSASSFKLYLSAVSFSFSDADRSNLETFMNKVDGYYDADARLNLLEQEMDKIRNDSIEMLETFRQIAIDNIKALNQIRSERYSSKLALDTKDPIQFKSHFGKVEVRNRELKKSLEKTIDNMHITYYLKGKDWLKWNDPAKARSFFERSIAEKSNYPPPFYELAQLDFNEKKYEVAIDSCAFILNTLKPDTDTRYSAVKLAESVITVYISEINLSIEQGEFILAMEKLTRCENYSKSIPGVKYFSEFDEIQGKLFKAYYLDLVKETTKAIEKKQLRQAQFNIDSLAEFRHVHRTYILNPEQEHLLLKELYSAWVNEGKEYMEKNVPDSSLFAFTQASILCHKHEVVYCTDELTQLIQQARISQYAFMVLQADNLISEQFADSALLMLEDAEKFRSQNNLKKNEQADELYLKAQQLKYADLIKIGEAAFNENKSREALAYYDEASAIIKSNAIIADTSFSTKVEMAATNYIILLCIQGETLVEALQLANARQKLNAAENLYNYYSITDSETAQVIASLKEKLQSGKCEKIQYSYNIQIIAAKKFIDQKEFIFAAQALDKAKRLSFTNKNCSLADSANRRLSNEIRTMLHYQKQMIKINELLDAKDYSDVIDEYIGLTTFYTDSCTTNFEIEHKDFYNYIFTHSDLGLIDYSVRYYTSEGKTDTALILLNELYSREYIASWSKQSQTVLGMQLALTDLEINPEADPKMKVLDYTKANKWYNNLKKAYLREWKTR